MFQLVKQEGTEHVTVRIDCLYNCVYKVTVRFLQHAYNSLGLHTCRLNKHLCINIASSPAFMHDYMDTYFEVLCANQCQTVPDFLLHTELNFIHFSRDYPPQSNSSEEVVVMQLENKKPHFVQLGLHQGCLALASHRRVHMHSQSKNVIVYYAAWQG